MRVSPIITTAATISCLVFAGCSSKPTDRPEKATGALPIDIDAKAAGALLEQEKPPVVLDVRTPGEFAAGHIEGAVNIDFKGPGFKDEIAKLDREQPYLLHCRSGNRSGQSKPTFTELGFKTIYHLDGGFLAWEEAGLPTVK